MGLSLWIIKTRDPHSQKRSTSQFTKYPRLVLKYWAQLFEGRLALKPGLNLTQVSFS